MTDPKATQEPEHESPRNSLADAVREWLVVLLLFVAVFSLLGAMSVASGHVRTGSYLLGVFTLVLIYALFATGLNLQFGFTGLINFGHVAFFALGAYAVATFARRRPICREAPTLFPDWLNWVCPGTTNLGWISPSGWGGAYALGLGIFVGLIAAGIFAMILGIPTLKLREDYLAIVTIGSAEILRIVFLNERWIAGGNPGEAVGGAFGHTTYPRPWFAQIRGSPGWQSAADSLHATPYPLFLALVALLFLTIVLIVFAILVNSPWGRVLKAIREDEDVAEALGKNVFKYKMQALVLGSAAAALAGVVYAWHNPPVSPEIALPILTFYAWIMLVIGGSGNLRGPLVGAVILWGIFESAKLMPLAMPDAASAIPFVDELGRPAGQILVIGLLLIFTMVFRPQGILGKREEMLLGK